MQTLLYVSAHNPWPPRSGGQVDIWHRLCALQELGVEVDLLLTTKCALRVEEREAIERVVRRLRVVPRTAIVAALAGRKPVQVAVRGGLGEVDLSGAEYDVALLDNEFCGAVIDNPTLRARTIALRVQNDEEGYQLRLAEAERNPLRRMYFRAEAKRMKAYVPEVWRKVDALWFISSDELARFAEWARGEEGRVPRGRFLPAGLDLRKAAQPALGSRKALFLGTLTVSLNQDAIRWYLRHVHPRLLEDPAYEFVIAGSTMGAPLLEFEREVLAHERVRLRCDVGDLQPLFAECGAFVSPMRYGAGVKLKTVEAALRGLPLVSTTVGAEGSGLVDGVHCCIADEPGKFAEALRGLFDSPGHAERMRVAATEYICGAYDQAKALRGALEELVGAGV